MKIIIEKIIEGKTAQLVLSDNELTVKVIYDGKCIDESNEATWANLKDSGLEEGYLNIYVETYLESRVKDKEFDEKLKEAGW